MLAGQFIDCFAHRALADLKALGKIHLAGDRFTRTPLACFQALGNEAFYLLIKREERRSGFDGNHVFLDYSAFPLCCLGQL
jgi:hypothetical protein